MGTEIIQEWGVQYPNGHIDWPFCTRAGAAQWRNLHPAPGAQIVDRVHLIGEWEPDPDQQEQ